MKPLSEQVKELEPLTYDDTGYEDARGRLKVTDNFKVTVYEILTELAQRVEALEAQERDRVIDKNFIRS